MNTKNLNSGYATQSIFVCWIPCTVTELSPTTNVSIAAMVALMNFAIGTGRFLITWCRQISISSKKNNRPHNWPFWNEVMKVSKVKITQIIDTIQYSIMLMAPSNACEKCGSLPYVQNSILWYWAHKHNSSAGKLLIKTAKSPLLFNLWGLMRYIYSTVSNTPPGSCNRIAPARQWVINWTISDSSAMGMSPNVMPQNKNHLKVANMWFIFC